MLKINMLRSAVYIRIASVSSFIENGFISTLCTGLPLRLISSRAARYPVIKMTAIDEAKFQARSATSSPGI